MPNIETMEVMFSGAVVFLLELERNILKGAISFQNSNIYLAGFCEDEEGRFKDAWAPLVGSDAYGKFDQGEYLGRKLEMFSEF
jgi:hypothetical protein